MSALFNSITEHKQAEEALKYSESRFRALTESTSDWIWEIDASGVYTYISPKVRDILGYDPDEVIGKAPFDLMPSEEATRVSAQFGAIVDSRMPFDRLENTNLHKDGRLIVMETSGVAFFDASGEFRGYRGVDRDITERKRVEENLRESEERYRLITDNMEDTVWLMDLNMRTTFISPSVVRTRGFTLEELQDMPLEQHLTPGSLEVALGEIAEHLAPEKLEQKDYTFSLTLDLEFYRKDGSTFWHEVKVSLLRDDGCATGLLFVSRDVTDRRQAEEALRRSEERFRTILDEMEEGYHELDLAGDLTFFNDSMCRMLGYSRKELMGMNYRTYTPEEDVKAVFQEYNGVYRTGKSVKGFPYKTIRKDGSTVHAEVSVLPLRNEQGEIVGFRGIRRDVTERKRMEEDLRQSEERYRLLAANAKDVIWTVDMNMRPTFMSPSITSLLGYSVEEAMVKSMEEVYTPASLEIAMELLAEELAIENMEHKDLSRSRVLEFELIHKDGSIVPIEGKFSFIRAPDAQPVEILSIARDITERKQMEEERKELEQKAQMESRLASLGLLASGVGHEINNPLTGVIGYAQLLLGRDIPEDIKKDLRAINEGAQRVANIVKKLVAFARYQKPQRTYAGISDIVAATVDLLAHQLETSNIKVTTRLDPNLPWTIADIGQLQQVFLNIIMNAETEMRLAHGKGKLSIKTEKTDNTIRISFQDDGPGIAKENLEKIFDPFFTTREVGQGTGLGLSICHEIMAEHGGRLYAQSEPGEGATFIVELPVVTEEHQEEAPEPVPEKAVKVATARILVVDDEPVVRDFVSRVLTDEGHEVETVDNAEDALKKIKSERYSLILLDMKLPGMRGDELYKRIQSIAGSLASRVVFITGDVLGAETTAFLSRIKASRIDKPFDAEQLKREINRILAQGKS